MPSRTEQHATHAQATERTTQGARRLQAAAGPETAAGPMPSELMAAMAMVQRACSKASRELAQLDPGTAQAIDLATSQIISDPCAALHVATHVGVAHNLLPALAGLSAELELTIHVKASKGLALGCHLIQLSLAQQAILAALPCAHQLPMPQSTSLQVREQVARALTHTLRLPFVSTADTVMPVNTTDHLVRLHGALKSAAMALNKVAQAMRDLTPAHQDVMQCDALTMVCRQVMDNDLALGMEAQASQPDGQTFKPLVAHRLLQSIRLLTDATTVFTEYFVRGISVSRDRISHGLASSLMLVTSNTMPQAV